MADVARLRQIVQECCQEQKTQIENPISGEKPFEISNEASTRFFYEQYGVDLREYKGDKKKKPEEFDAYIRKLVIILNKRRQEKELV